MKYFEKYLAEHAEAGEDLEDIDIAVHCDITIFDWLMRYVHGLEPRMDPKTAVSILISAEFLQMDTLIDESLNYVSQNLQAIIKQPIDMCCMSSGLVKRLAGKVNIQMLESVQDRKDKLKSKIFMKKLEILFQDDRNMLYRCAYCSELFTEGQR